MRALLDTHAFLWWVTDDARLSDTAREVIADGHNEIHVSAATGWEIATGISGLATSWSRNSTKSGYR